MLYYFVPNKNNIGKRASEEHTAFFDKLKLEFHLQPI